MNILSKDINLSQEVGIGATITIFEYTVPTRSILKVTHFGNYLATIAAWGDITWRILQNGVGLYPYDEIIDQIGMIDDPRVITPFSIPGGDTIRITITNNSADLVGAGIALRYDIIEGE